MMRQLGGSFGIALINTYVANRAFENRLNLSSHVTVFDYPTQERMLALSGAFQRAGSTLGEAQTQALAVINGLLAQQSAVISYADTFRVLTFFFLLCIPLVLFLRRPRGAPVVVTADH